MLEQKIKPYSMKFGDLSFQRAPVTDIIKNLPKKYISKGMFSRVFKFQEEKWVMKEGRWDMDFNVWGDVFVPLPTEQIESLLEPTAEVTFLPKIEEIKRQFKLYRTVVKYFAYYSNKDIEADPDKAILHKEQKKIREGLIDSVGKYEKALNLTINKNIYKVLESDLKYYDFLPKEYTLIGKSISEANRGKDTVYIFQEFIEGKCMADVKVKDLPGEFRSQLALFAYLLLVLKYEEKLLLDTRPRYPLMQFSNWLFKTDNMIVSKNGVKFIDTRWMWETDSNLVKRGLLIPDLITLNTKFHLNNILKNI